MSGKARLSHQTPQTEGGSVWLGMSTFDYGMSKSRPILSYTDGCVGLTPPPLHGTKEQRMYFLFSLSHTHTHTHTHTLVQIHQVTIQDYQLNLDFR